MKFEGDYGKLLELENIIESGFEDIIEVLKRIREIDPFLETEPSKKLVREIRTYMERNFPEGKEGQWLDESGI